MHTQKPTLPAVAFALLALALLGCDSAMPTGGNGQPCSSYGACDLGLQCLAGTCSPATGGERQPCYGNGTCNEGLVCASEVCVRLVDGGLDAAIVDDAAVIDDAASTQDADVLDGGTVDASAATSDASICGHAGGPPYGTLVGRTFAPLTLPDCAGEPHAFYTVDGCAASYTVVTMTAAWNVPSGQLLGGIAGWRSSYMVNRGMRFMDILVQDASYQPPTNSTCAAWQSARNTPLERMDPAQMTMPFYPDGALPAVVVVDSAGVIRYAQVGATATALHGALDALP